VLDEAVMPVVTYPRPGGLDRSEGRLFGDPQPPELRRNSALVAGRR
jgi:hypothetical protein